MARLPATVVDDDEAARSRAEFASGLKELEKHYGGERAALGHLAVGSTQPFYLAYQRGNHRDLLRAYGDLCARLMAAWRGAAARPSNASRRDQFVLGVVSAHVGDHSVWTAIARGWLDRLDRERIDVRIFDLRKDAAGLGTWVKRITEAKPDALLYPEVGMDAMTLRLAALRLAPRQLASWGHPMTTGLPTIDAYISADAMEPADAQDHYREKLVRLPGLGVFYEPLDAPNEKIDLARLGLPADRPLLLCPGLPFKYAARDDAVWAAIARRAANAHLVFFDTGPVAVREALRKRLEHAFVAAGLRFDDHVTLVPQLSRPQFFALMRRSALFLDSIGFSGFNTAMQAVECELPIVTLEGDALRGRFGAGILREMGLGEYIANDVQSYADIAVRLAQDADERERIRTRMREARAKVFGTEAPVRELEAFLLRNHPHQALPPRV
jgi:predicted O-linked N-acetylglucosamine transferase (SPINDLY family)